MRPAVEIGGGAAGATTAQVLLVDLVYPRPAEPRIRRRQTCTSCCSQSTSKPGGGTVGDELLAAGRRRNGPDHISTLSNACWVGADRRKVHRLDEAIELLSDTFERGKQHAPTEDHPTWLSGHLLAFTHSEAGHLEEAVELGREVLAARRRLHGPDHVFTLMTASCLGANLRDTQQMSEAIALLTDTFRRGQRNAPDKDWPTWSTGYELTLTLAMAGRLSEAAEVGTEVFAARRHLFGPNDIDTLGAAWNLAAILRQTGRFDPAIELLTDTYDRARRSTSVGQGTILTLGYELAATLARPGRLNEAVCRRFPPPEMAADR